MTLEAADSWKPVGPGDIYNNTTLPRMEEGFKRPLEDGVMLWYLRATEEYPLSGGDPVLSGTLTYFARQDAGDEKATALVKLIGGGIALHGAPDVQMETVALAAHEDRLGEYLAQVADLLREIHPYFSGVPTSNVHYPAELDTLSTVIEGAELFREGQVTDGDIVDLFWYCGREIA